MPRPEPFTEEVRRKRREEQAKIDNNAFRRADERTDAEIQRDEALAANLIDVLGLAPARRRAGREEIASEPGKAICELAGILVVVRWHWQVRQDIEPDRSLPILGGVQPTHGEMHVTLEAGLKHAEKLRDWYRSLPAALLLKATVPFAEESPVLGVVIERLTETLALLAAEHKPQLGRQPGRRAVAQSAARYLIRFVDRHAPDASTEAHRTFVFRAMRGLGIDCPDLRDDPRDFASWFSEVEALAGPSAKPSRPT
jgi:hypothetical protein